MNIPIVGQTFEIDGYKSIECTADANADAKAFAKANGIPVSEAKYILETLYGSARQTQSAADKATEGVTDTTPDEDAEVDGADAEIMDAIDNLTTALEDNENVDKSLVEQITSLLIKLIGGTTTTNDTGATDNTNNTNNTNNNNNVPTGDWAKLEVEGKGVNINNVINLVQKAVRANPRASFDTIYDSFSIEEKAVIDKFFPKGTSKKQISKFFKLFSEMYKNGEDVTMLAFAMNDTDGDGFLTDNEIRKLVNTIARQDFSTLGEQLGDNGVCSTTINGEKVYFVHYPGTKSGGAFLALTEDEINKMEPYFNEENKDKYVGKGKDGADVAVVWEALGATRGEKRQILTNSAGVTSAVFDNGALCSLCDDRLYAAYTKIKKAIENDK